MESSHALLDIYQLRIVMRGISPLIWRRLLVRRDTTLAQLHDILQFLFDWSGEHLHEFHIYGKDYGSNGADTRDVRLSDFRLHPGERFRYVYDFGAYWQCDIRLEASLPASAKRFYPVCIGGKGAAPPEHCRSPWAYMEMMDDYRHPPLDATWVAAEAVRAVLEAAPQSSIREAIGDMEALREAVEQLRDYPGYSEFKFYQALTRVSARRLMKVIQNKRLIRMHSRRMTAFHGSA
jgi:Plasmid pRiA4b ORF-3-like protein